MQSNKPKTFSIVKFNMEIEFNNTKNCPVKDLLSLIRQDSIENLRQALLNVIDAANPNGEIYLYEQGYSLYQSSDRPFSPTLLACRSKNEDCMKKAQEMQLSGDANSIQFDGFKYLPTDDYVQVFTVESERSSRGLLISVNKSIVDEHYIYTLLSAYNHQVHLLRNKDTDSLTGLFNRQSFDSKLAKLHANLDSENRSDDEPSHFCFALIDIDFFKKVNDKYGHVYGDEVLLLFSNLMKETFRDADMLFRYGGEEFAVLLHNISLEQANSVLNRFRTNIENFNFPMDNKVTASIGSCEFSNQVPLSVIVGRADKALYYSKENGRNLVSSFEKLLANNQIKDIIIDEGDIELF